MTVLVVMQLVEKFDRDVDYTINEIAKIKLGVQFDKFDLAIVRRNWAKCGRFVELV